MKVALPAYVAVIGCVPTARFVPVLLVAPVIVNVATPDVVRVAVPFVTVPSLNVTVPVAAVGETVAVRVTLAPRLGVGDELASTMLEATLLTLRLKVAALVALLASVTVTV